MPHGTATTPHGVQGLARSLQLLPQRLLAGHLCQGHCSLVPRHCSAPATKHRHNLMYFMCQQDISTTMHTMCTPTWQCPHTRHRPLRLAMTTLLVATLIHTPTHTHPEPALQRMVVEAQGQSQLAARAQGHLWRPSARCVAEAVQAHPTPARHRCPRQAARASAGPQQQGRLTRSTCSPGQMLHLQCAGPL